MAQPVSEYQDIRALSVPVMGARGSLFLLLRITDPGEAKAWLAAVVEPGAGSYPTGDPCRPFVRSYQDRACRLPSARQA
jgi:hypothetical protein